ncbi:ATP-grasp domain-containing protein [Leptothoe spongobia]|uniref:ATP-grasp domain-containing protein n=1 Tax=Leptothoe spongobia TAU-MAC 1115 TaxID=1967444 RepID=A0A947DEJ3_9CYAN|nr:ATP-grasp domain-containing protein [Leptothoe spongobia TAU-MAC 1115]
MNLLFTSAGRRVSLIRNFKTSMEKLNIRGNIITADRKKDASACFVSDYSEQVPPVSDPTYIDVLLKICRDYEITLLIPLIDPELSLLSRHSKPFEDIGIKLLVSSPEVNKICINKRVTYDFFKSNHISTPQLYSLEELSKENNRISYPLIIKPANGSCSINVNKVHNFKELIFFLHHTQNPIIQEYISGEEYTLDILVDFEGKAKVVVPRLRMETRAGESSKGITVKNSALIEAGKKVAESLPGAIGCITAQCFLTKEGDIKFIEINPRFGGGFPLSYHAGADFPGWILAMAQGQELQVSIDEWKDGIVMLRFDDAIFTTKNKI